MNVLVISDTHGNETNLKRVLLRHADVDAVLHLGDYEGSREYILQLIRTTTKKRENTAVYMVRGNCDYGSDVPLQRVVEIAGHRLFMTHGHRYDVSWGDLTLLAYKAEEEQCGIALFGHIHQPVITLLPGRAPEDPEMLIVNPGSLSRPRQEGYRPSYMLLELNPDCRPIASLQYV